MQSNFHTHTPRCNHATGTEREYIECALQAGISTLGFSDHAPYLFDTEHYSTFRMYPEQLPEYVHTLHALREEYHHALTLHIGVELEYYPRYFERTLDFLREKGVEYCILGQHFVADEPFCAYSGVPTEDETVLAQYVRSCIAGMERGIYTYLAHPDLIHFVGNTEVYRKWMGTLIRQAKACSVPLECNLLGLRENRHYPNDLFLALVGEENGEMILGRDAHNPDMLLDAQTEEKAKALLSHYGIGISTDIEPKRL